jgi:hypothetical protein
MGLLAISITAAQGQTRVNDKDVENLMRNLKEDAKKFKPMFNNAIKKSTIRKTSREKDAKSRMTSFVNQTEAMLNNFKRTKKGDSDFSLVRSSAAEIDKVVNEIKLEGEAASMWQKIRTELDQVGGALGVSQASAQASCEQSIGVEQAHKLVEECLQVSPATRPPCNAQNPCELIISEIKRSCGMLQGTAAPDFCNQYR